jgi:hypothetical protein
MKEAITNGNIVTLLAGILFIGGLSAIFKMYRAAKLEGESSFYDQIGSGNDGMLYI